MPRNCVVWVHFIGSFIFHRRASRDLFFSSFTSIFGVRVSWCNFHSNMTNTSIFRGNGDSLSCAVSRSRRVESIKSKGTAFLWNWATQSNITFYCCQPRKVPLFFCIFYSPAHLPGGYTALANLSINSRAKSLRRWENARRLDISFAVSIHERSERNADSSRFEKELKLFGKLRKVKISYGGNDTRAIFSSRAWTTVQRKLFILLIVC